MKTGSIIILPVFVSWILMTGSYVSKTQMANNALQCIATSQLLVVRLKQSF